MQKINEKFYVSSGKRTILVADDELINREILGAVLENDYDVLFAEDGEAALSAIRSRGESISLVLLDLMMPKISGIEVLKYIKDDPETNQIPVIVVTAD